MANKNKNLREQLYRDHLGERWRFIKDATKPWGASWLMMRVKDGYRSYWPPSDLTPIPIDNEQTNPNPQTNQ